MSRTLPLRNSLQRFMEDPGSPRRAAGLIVSATSVAVIAGALVVWTFDHSEYPSFGRAIWYTLQTVTTVGYGDVTPERSVGRVVGGVVMLTGIGFLTIVTAAITSTFVEAARRKATKAEERDESELATLETALASITERLERIEKQLARATEPPPKT